MDNKRIFDISKTVNESPIKGLRTIDPGTPSENNIPYEDRSDELENDGLEYLYDRKTPPLDGQS